MKAARTPGALILLATCWMLGGTSRAAENAALERFNRAQEILSTLGSEVIVERAIFRDELDLGVSRNAWSKRERDAALEQVRSAFRLTGEEKPGAAGFVPPWYSMSEARTILTSGDPSRATAPLLGWLGWRIGALRDVREEARRALRTAALDFAEETWLAARTPADLESAVRLLNEARLSFDRMWGIVDQARGSGPLGKPSDRVLSAGSFSPREAVDVYDFLSVLMSPEPFFLPDPNENPAGFAAGRAIWPDLVRIGHAFTLRPVISARFQRHDAIYRNLLLAVGNRLNELIEHNATAAEFEPPYLQWRALANPPPHARQVFLGKAGDIQRITEYRNLVAWRNVAAQGPPPIRTPPPQATAYRAWLTLRQTEETADLEKIQTARVDLYREISSLPSSTSAYLMARNRADADIPPGVAEAAKPVDALIAGLRGFLSQKERNGSADAKALLAIWEPLRDGAASPRSASESPIADHWTAFSVRHGSHSFFTLRDRAARQLLVQIYPAEAALSSSTVPLITELRERLTAALTSGGAELARKLLALDAAGAFLLPAEHQAWVHDSVLLREADALLAAGERESARSTYTQAIRQLTDPTLSEFAARQARVLKSSPKK